MANAFIAFPNRTDEATLSGGSWVTSLPLTNLQNRLLGKVARSTNLLPASTTFTADLGRLRYMRLFSLINHNLSLDATFQIETSDFSDFSVIAYDSGVIPVWDSVYSTQQLEWEFDNFWFGQLTEEDREGFTLNLVHIPNEPVANRYVRFKFFDETNPDGYVQFGRLFLSGDWQPSINASYGLQLGYESRTQVDEALSGAEFFDERKAPRVVRFDINNLKDDEAMTRALDMQRILDTSGEVFFVYDPDDTLHLLRRSFLARPRQLNPLEIVFNDRWNTNYELKELI